MSVAVSIAKCDTVPYDGAGMTQVPGMADMPGMTR